MINFMENPRKVRRLTLDGISLSREKVKIRLALKNKTEGIVVILTNVFYFSYSPSNLVSLGLLNNVKIYYHNKDQILYNLKTQKTLAFVE